LKARKPTIFLIIVLTVFFVMNVSFLSWAQNNNQSSTTNEYKDETNGLTFQIPEGINLYTTENPGPLASQISMDAPYIFVNPAFTEENINVKITENISENDLADFKKMLEDNPSQPLPGYRRISVRTIKIGTDKNKTAIEHIFIMQGNILGKLRQVVFVNNGRGFIFTCATAVDRFDNANQQFFQRVFDSMVFK